MRLTAVLRPEWRFVITTTVLIHSDEGMRKRPRYMPRTDQGMQHLLLQQRLGYATGAHKHLGYVMEQVGMTEEPNDKMGEWLQGSRHANCAS